MPASSAMRRREECLLRKHVMMITAANALIALHCGSNLDEYDIFAHLYCRQADNEGAVITETAPLRTPPISTSITSERTGRQSVPDDRYKYPHENRDVLGIEGVRTPEIRTVQQEATRSLGHSARYGSPNCWAKASEYMSCISQDQPGGPPRSS